MPAPSDARPKETQPVRAGTGCPCERRKRARRLTPGKAELFYANPLGERRAEPVEIKDVSAEGMSIYAPGPVAAGQRVEVQFEHATHAAAVSYCKKLGKGYLAGLYFMPPERRRQGRLRTSGQARLYWTGQRGKARLSIVNVRNISDYGLQIDLREPIEVPQLVRISGDDMECLGWALYCRQEDGQCVAGIELSGQPYPKDSLDFRD